ncbi:MAG: alcohol dehydrogenase catalytic domain-containing protein [Armatimonadetes bacterium]|nr:alcohol dehydrogenase catalytic domain-containing protein [Armatimonadota bacterium]
MRGVVLTGDKKLIIKEFPDPIPGPNQVVVKMKASAICGSDMYTYRAPAERVRHRGEVIQGHEPAGIVELVGPGVTKVQPGDRVTIYHYMGCGHCEHCAAGNLMWCSDTRGLGGRAHGGHADKILVNEVNACKLPDELSFVDGAAIACIAGTTFSALSKINPSGKDSVAVLGLGPVGLCGVMFAKALGDRVIAIGRRSIRLDLARQLGADEIVDIDQGEAAWKAVPEIQSHKGVDAVYETAGTADAFWTMMRMLRKGGRAVLASGGRYGEGRFDPGMIISKQLSIFGSFVMPLWMYDDLARFMVAKNLHFEPMVTHRFSLDQAEEAFALVDSGECGKVIFEWP